MITIEKVSNFKFRKIDEEIILFDITNKSYYELNEIALSSVLILEPNKTIDDVINKIKIKTHEDIAEDEFLNFIHRLSNYHFITTDISLPVSQQISSKFLFIPLTDSKLQADSCKSFGMPKRSCLLLPSGS